MWSLLAGILSQYCAKIEPVIYYVIYPWKIYSTCQEHMTAKWFSHSHLVRAEHTLSLPRLSATSQRGSGNREKINNFRIMVFVGGKWETWIYSEKPWNQGFEFLLCAAGGWKILQIQMKEKEDLPVSVAKHRPFNLQCRHLEEVGQRHLGEPCLSLFFIMIASLTFLILYAANWVWEKWKVDQHHFLPI